MLSDLTIKDFAIIAQDEIDFQKGFTVLTGETGAGKSILIGAITFLLGGVANSSLIRNGKNSAEVTATFNLENIPNALYWLNEHGIDDNGGMAILRRNIRSTGKSTSWINGTNVTKKDMEEFASFLIDIHGQHEHQSLLKVSEHRVALDSRAWLTEDVKNYTTLYNEMMSKKRELNTMESDETIRTRNIDMYRYAIDEIESAKLKENEDIDLEAEETRLSSFEKLYSDVDEAKTIMDGGEGGAVALLKKALKALDNAKDLDEKLKGLAERTEAAFYEISDISNEVSSYCDRLFFDPNRLSQIEERLSLIYNLKKKYASINSPLSAINDYLFKTKEALGKLEHANENKDALRSEIAELEKKVLNSALDISLRRTTAAKALSGEVEGILQTLGMKGAKFSVSVTQRPGESVDERCNSYGLDNVEFLIAANKGSLLQPLSKIASGGEISRVMLALKTVFASEDSLSPETLIFDEIDTGIGGVVAIAVGEHMKKLSATKQVFCITHQASIASFASHQAKIEKSDEEDVTVSRVHYVTGDERVSEIARMLSGDEESRASLDHARELLEKANLLLTDGNDE